jgi:hypothetical protein
VLKKAGFAGSSVTGEANVLDVVGAVTHRGSLVIVSVRMLV